MSFDRRRFLQGSLLSAAALITPSFGFMKKVVEVKNTGSKPVKALVIDTNVHLSQWPFRKLKYAGPDALVNKLQQHGVREAWAGSYDALFHKNIDRVNARLSKDCHQYGDGMLIPFGTVNPRWPDWVEDLRRCDEEYNMPGIRLYPGYQNYTLELPEFTELLQKASDRRMIVQIAIDMEDERMQHPMVDIPAVDVSPLPSVLEKAPNANVQLLNPFRHVRGDELELMVEKTEVKFGISNLDGIGALERIIDGNHVYLGSTVTSDRLLIGSNVPFRPLENVLFKLIESELTKEDAVAIMSGNAGRMLQRTQA